MAATYRQTISIDLFTDTYRVTGNAEVRTGGIQAELSNPSSDYFELSDVYVSRIHQPGEITANYSECAFRKQNINFIIVQNRREGSSTGSTPPRSKFTRGRPLDVFLAVPAFEIQGTVHYEGSASPMPTSILTHSAGSFQPVLEAKAVGRALS